MKLTWYRSRFLFGVLEMRCVTISKCSFLHKLLTHEEQHLMSLKTVTKRIILNSKTFLSFSIYTNRAWCKSFAIKVEVLRSQYFFPEEEFEKVLIQNQRIRSSFNCCRWPDLGSICPREAADTSKQGMFLLKGEGSLQKNHIPVLNHPNMVLNYTKNYASDLYSPVVFLKNNSEIIVYHSK
jgi:hypothetical protein